MKLGKIFICINILVLSLLMLTGWPRIIYQNTSYRFDEYNRTVAIATTLQKRRMVMTLLQNEKKTTSYTEGEKYIEIGRVTYAVAI